MGIKLCPKNCSTYKTVDYVSEDSECRFPDCFCKNVSGALRYDRQMSSKIWKVRDMKHYFVRGGIYTDTNWTDLTPGSREEYGPFETYEDAKKAWVKGMFSQKLDICTHRLFIKEFDKTLPSLS